MKAIGGQMEQNRNHNSSHGVGASDGGDAVMARWLQSAGLQHLAAPLQAAALDHRLLPSLLMQDYARYGVQSLEDKQKLFRLIKTISSSGADSVSEPSTPPTYSRSASQSGMDGFLSPELRGDFNSGILDLHSIDDTEFFPEIAMPEPFQSSPSFVPVIEKGFESDLMSTSFKGRMQGGLSGSSPLRSVSNERDKSGNISNLARIRVVVRKRPLNKKEVSRKEEDIVTINDTECSLTVHEPKVKVDLTAYVEKHEFVFDAVLNQQVSNDEVYRSTVEPIVPTIFNRTKATCFAYGQTGSGKTYTMQPLPLRACEDIMAIMQQSSHRNQGFQLWLSFFEIYGGKLYDLLNERRKLCMREDGRQQVCIVGLKEFRVSDVELVKEYIDKGNQSRSTGSTGANEESSRSHAILQLVVKKTQEGKEVSRVVGKISFIDLAGSERGADTTDNDRQTRMEGAEINKSLLALKECIRALDNEQGHIPFRGSKLTEVLRDSFVGDSRTVMISCVSPNAGSCEHTLNTLRYADRVKGLSKNNNSKRDMNSTTSLPRESNSSPPSLLSATQVAPQVPELGQDNRLAENGRRPPLDPGRYLQQGERELSNQSIEYSYSGRELGKVNTAATERDRQNYTDTSESDVHDDLQDIDRVQGGFTTRRKGGEEKYDRLSSRDDLSKPEGNSRRQVEYSRDEPLKPDGNSRRQYEYNRDDMSKPDGNSRRQYDYNRDESSKPDGNSRRQYEYNRDEVSKPDQNSRRQFEYNRDETSKPDGNSRRQSEYNREEGSKPDGSSRRQPEYNREEGSKPDGSSRRQPEYNREEVSKPDGSSRRQPEYNREEVSKPDGNSRRQFEYNRDETSKPDGNSRRQSEYNRDEVSKPDVNSRRQFEYNRDEVSKPDGNSRRQFEYNRDEVSKLDGNSRRQTEYSRDEVSKPDGNSRRQFEYNRDEVAKPDGNSRRQFEYSRDDTSKPEGNSRRQLDHTRIDSEANPVPYNREGHINAILEEEEEVISAHRKEVEDTMEIVREEMKLLAEVDQPGSRIDRYVSQLNYVLSRKAAGIVNLQARLARFQRHLKEQEILSRAGGLRQV
ncbi:hypothetical protein KC19_2G195600 [Ceratodon purpureus]|uniref:Kinesin-like protein n=1 Tax=Ceratodon purpureus TaxID=3225 RepID=A0A8T0IYP9_CERPU|nr:hypothetical protein KC19_2G195600 [Ceratodon purpureus]